MRCLSGAHEVLKYFDLSSAYEVRLRYLVAQWYTLLLSRFSDYPGLLTSNNHGTPKASPQRMMAEQSSLIQSSFGV